MSSETAAIVVKTDEENQTIQLLRHYARYFPDNLFIDKTEALAAAANAQKPSPEVNAEADSSLNINVPEHHMYILSRIIGRGQSSASFVCTRLSDDQQSVAKIVLLRDENHVAYAHSEVQCLACCHYFGIIKQFDDFEREDKVLLIMEYASGGDLAGQIRQRTKEKFPFKEHEVGLLFLQITLALDYVHNLRMIHRDLKTANIFLMPTGVVKLGDFGFTRQYGDNVSLNVGTSFCGTPSYLAPEIWEGKRYSKKADMWSLGVILYELLTLQKPFKGPSQTEVMRQVLYGTFDPFPTAISAEMEGFVKSLLNQKPELRPTTKQLLSTEFMKYVMTVYEEIAANSDVIPPDDKKEIFKQLQENRNQQMLSTQVCSPISPSQDVYYAGYLFKFSNTRQWKRRYFVLEKSVFRISLTDKTPKDSVESQSVALNLIIDVLPTPAAYSKSHPHQFVIWFVNGKKIMAKADTAEEKNAWITALHAALGMG